MSRFPLQHKRQPFRVGVFVCVELKESGNRYITLVKPRDISSSDGIKNDLVSKRYYDATFFQLKTGIDAKAWKSEVSAKIAQSAGVPLSKLSHEELEEQLNQLPRSLTSNIAGIVWLTLEHHYFLDRIVLYYDNFQNRPRGEDL